MLRKFLSITLLVVFMGMNFFIHLLYQFQIEVCHSTAKEKIEADEVEINTITFADNNSIHWRIKGKEFEYNGKLYDVAEIAYGKIITIQYFEDSKEESVEKVFRDLSKAENLKHKITKSVNEFEFLPVIDVLPLNTFNSKNNFTKFSSPVFARIFFNVDSPPPEV